MCEKIPPGVYGSAKVEHFTIGEPSVRMLLRPSEFVAPGSYARLLVNNHIMMSDTDMERRSNRHFVSLAHGHVLVGGLGLGMVVFALLQKDEVTSLTVIEKNADVVRLVQPHLPKDKRLSVIEANVFTWKPTQKYQTIYFDIWPDMSTDNLDDMTKLHRRYARSLDRTDPSAWMGSWQQDLLRRHRRQERNQHW